jgi:hypothetical protein
MLLRKLVFVFIFTFSLSLSAEGIRANKNGFDVICQIYTEAINSSMSKDQLRNYIFDNVENRVKSIDALEAHVAVFNLPPEKRYPIFKESAEYSLKNKWDCVAIKSLMK